MLDASTTAAPDPRSETVGANDAALRGIAADAGKVSLLVADVSGVLDQVHARIDREGEALESLRDAADALSASNTEVIEAASAAARTGEVERARIRNGLAAVAQMVNDSSGLTDSAETMGVMLGQLNDALSLVSRAAEEIGAIARMTSLLAVNATIEAARAGDTGRGFKIIAQEVKGLSERTSQTTEQIGRTLEQLSEQTAGVTSAADTMLSHIHTLRDGGADASQALSVISEAMETVITWQEHIQQAVRANSDTITHMHDSIATLSSGAAQTRTVMGGAERQVSQLFTASQNLMGACVSLDIETEDSPFVAAATATAARIGTLFNAAIIDGRMTEEALFVTQYHPVPGTDPPQFTTPALSLTDSILPGVQEPVLNLSDKVVFCAAVDINGYLPTHNAKFAQAQRPGDPVWNTANARHRRIFDDRTGLAAARNTKPFLLQVYRRDMGGGSYLLMKDVSAPILVRGRHWGALRLAYKA